MYCRLLSFTYLWVRQFEILISPKHFYHRLLCLSFAIPGYQLLPVFLSDVKAQLSDIYKFISVDVDRVQCYAIRPGSVRNRHADTGIFARLFTLRPVLSCCQFRIETLPPTNPNVSLSWLELRIKEPVYLLTMFLSFNILIKCVCFFSAYFTNSIMLS